MYVYKSISYPSQSDALRAVNVDEKNARNELKKSKCFLVANLAMTAVLPLMLMADHLGWTELTPQTRALSWISLGYCIIEDCKMALNLSAREKKINDTFQAARFRFVRP